MSGRRDSSKRSRDLALSELEEKAKELEKSRQHFRNEIDRIDHSLTQIRVEYAKIYNESSLFLNLPTEVLCVILDLAASAHQLEDPDTDEKSLLPEVVMSHVCKHLRDVALDYPALWTRFYFFLDNVKSEMSNTLTRFDTYIKRSRSQNLELFLNFTEGRAGRLPLEEQLNLLDRAIKHINRWKTVTLMLDGEAYTERLFPTLMAASAPNLEYFSYLPRCREMPVGASGEINFSKPGLLQGGTPKLRCLLLDSSSLILPAFSTLTTLRIEIADDDYGIPYSLESFLAMLSLPFLTNFSSVGHTFVDSGRDQVPIVTMNNLKHLRYSNTPYMTRILPFLRAPLLESLWIQGYTDPRSATEFDLHVPSESYFFPSLQDLVLLCTLQFTSDSARRIVQLTKNINRLTILEADDFFTALSADAPLDNLNERWPKLSAITAMWPYPESDHFVSLSDVVLARPEATVKVWIPEYLHDSWKSKHPHRGIIERCTVELLGREWRWDVRFTLPSWPPGVSSPNYPLWNDQF